jgi:FkbM family methyltransferase
MMEVNYKNFIRLLTENATVEKVEENDRSTKKSLNNIRKGSKIYIWPFGRIGRRIYEELTNNGYENIVLVDKSSSLDNVIPPEDISFAADDVLIISTLTHSNEVYNIAQAMNCKNIIMYYHIKRLIKPVIFPDDFFDKCFEDSLIHLLENVEKYKSMFFSLADDKSKKNFLNNMFFRLTSDIRYTFDYDTKLQYFVENIKFTPEDVILDGGGYTGDTLERFLKLNVPYKSYYLFEPDEALLKRAKQVSNDPKIKYVNKGLFSKPTTLKFNKTDTMGGQIGANGADIIEVTSVDDYVREKVSFLKLDIEGAELEALKGSRNTIMQDSPILAICIYHKPSDYIDIYELIKSLNPTYKFFIRHHEDFYAETVLYAIPDDKLRTRSHLES